MNIESFPMNLSKNSDRAAELKPEHADGTSEKVSQYAQNADRLTARTARRIESKMNKSNWDEISRTFMGGDESKPPSTESPSADHTPTPWHMSTVSTSVGVCHKIGPLGSSTKIHYACLYDDCYSDIARDLVLLADAEFIVQACNVHDDLLAAAKAIINSSDYDDDNRPLMRNLRIAVAKAEGKSNDR